ncbi:hypothetical protein FJZ48_02215 [Candidatus Uhrbacteria bacterium]|nr:hypothetical protein [Candidatus Uhrbacteria bacterium]
MPKALPQHRRLKEHHRKQHALTAAFVMLAIIAFAASMAWQNKALMRDAEMLKNQVHSLQTKSLSGTTSTEQMPTTMSLEDVLASPVSSWKLTTDPAGRFQIKLPTGFTLINNTIYHQDPAMEEPIALYSIETSSQPIERQFAGNELQKMTIDGRPAYKILQKTCTANGGNSGPQTTFAIKDGEARFIFDYYYCLNDALQGPILENIVKSYISLAS